MKKELLKISYTLKTIEDAARIFWEATQTYPVFAFSGEMGAGKTTFIHTLCDMLLVEDTVSSPTLALINEYHFPGIPGKDAIISHIDWYRLKDAAEAINAGMEDCLAAASNEVRCFIEWPEKATDLLRAPYLWISITTSAIDERTMTVTLIS